MPDMDVRHYTLGVVDKFAEARFFLQKVEGAADFVECCYFTSAFGSACYSVIECLKRTSRATQETRHWWSLRLKDLKTSPVHRYFHEGRNVDIHEGFGLVEGINLELKERNGELIAHEKWLLIERPSHSVGSPAQECRDYFESLLRIALDGYRRFAAVWDPDAQLAQSFGKLEREELRPTH